MDDLISRQAALDWIINYVRDAIKCNQSISAMCYIWSHIRKMPSAQPETIKGQWEDVYDCCGSNYKCSNCGRKTHTAITFDIEGNQYKYEFCPHCGADMRGESNE